MHRIEDNYKWKTLQHWRIALETGKVQIKIVEQRKITDVVIEEALKLLRNDCFPIAIICYKNKLGEKEIWLTSLWKGIFDFLDGGRCLEVEKKMIWFGEMTDDEKKSILNAQIISIWIADN